MPKDTKTLGNSKARACESLGFVHKKGCARVLTQPHILHKNESYFNKNKSILYNTSSRFYKSKANIKKTTLPLHQTKKTGIMKNINNNSI